MKILPSKEAVALRLLLMVVLVVILIGKRKTQWRKFLRKRENGETPSAQITGVFIYVDVGPLMQFVYSEETLSGKHICPQ